MLQMLHFVLTTRYHFQTYLLQVVNLNYFQGEWKLFLRKWHHLMTFLRILKISISDWLSIKLTERVEHTLPSTVINIDRRLLDFTRTVMKETLLFGNSFTLKALFVLKVFKFLSQLFGHVEKTARLERKS